MKLNKTTRQFIISEVEHYAHLLKIKTIPDLCFELVPMSERSKNHKQWGHYFYAKDPTGRMIFINVDKHGQGNTKELVYSIVHELVHVKYPRLKHGPKFDKIVDSYFSPTF